MNPVALSASSEPLVTGAFPRRSDWWLLAAGLRVLFVFCLGSRGLNEPDEGRYANVAMAMARPGGDWWEPRQSGYGHYDKPPLVYWVTALAFRAFGFNEWAARLPPCLGAAMALAGLALGGGAPVRGARGVVGSVLLCGTSVQFWVIGRLLSPDMLLTGWCALAVAAWAECRHRGGRMEFLVGVAGVLDPGVVDQGHALAHPAGGRGWWEPAPTGDAAGRRALRPWLLTAGHRHPRLALVPFHAAPLPGSFPVFLQARIG